MAITINKEASGQEIQEKIENWYRLHSGESKARKKKMVKDTFGNVKFDASKTPEEIQKELRNEWK